MTERDLLDALHDKLGSEAQGNGGHRWIIAEKVRARAGFAGWGDREHGRLRTADALAIDTWISKGMELHGFEMKCSRSDWLTELRQPEKSEAFRRVCDRWWLVTSDPAIVKDGELPGGWGHMTLTTRYEQHYVDTAVWLPSWQEVPNYARTAKPRAWASVPVTSLRRVSPAPKMADRDPIPRHLLATIMRATMVTAQRRASVS